MSSNFIGYKIYNLYVVYCFDFHIVFTRLIFVVNLMQAAWLPKKWQKIALQKMAVEEQ